MNHHHATEAEETRWPLPLREHPFLELVGDFVVLTVTPLASGEEPYLELHEGRGHNRRFLPRVVVHGAKGTTSVRVDGATRAFEERIEAKVARRERWWEGVFDKHRMHHMAKMELVAHVPVDLRASIRASAGKVTVEKLHHCELAIDVDAGTLFLDDVTGKLRLATQAGRIDGRGLGGAIEVSTSAGALKLEIVSLDPGTHRVRTSMGAALVELAQGMPVQIDTRTIMGSSRVDAMSTRGAAAILEVEAELGAIRVVDSRRTWRAPKGPAAAAGPYRTAEEPSSSSPSPSPSSSDSADDDAEVAAILARVADGSLSPAAARDLLRAIGFG